VSQLKLIARDERGAESLRYMIVSVIQVVIPVFPQYKDVPSRVQHYHLSVTVTSKHSLNSFYSLSLVDCLSICHDRVVVVVVVVVF